MRQRWRLHSRARRTNREGVRGVEDMREVVTVVMGPGPDVKFIGARWMRPGGPAGPPCQTARSWITADFLRPRT